MHVRTLSFDCYEYRALLKRYYTRKLFGSDLQGTTLNYDGSDWIIYAPIGHSMPVGHIDPDALYSCKFQLFHDGYAAVVVKKIWSRSQ